MLAFQGSSNPVCIPDVMMYASPMHVSMVWGPLSVMEEARLTYIKGKFKMLAPLSQLVFFKLILY